MSYQDLRAAVYVDAPVPIDSSNAFCYSEPFLFVSDFEKGIHVFDCSDPVSPNNIAFVHVPGITQLAVSGNRLYVNSYVDLVVLDISDIHAIHESGRIENTLTYRSYNSLFADPDQGVIIGFEARDTVIVEECGYQNGTIGMVYYDEPYLHLPAASGEQSGYLSYFKSTGDTLICFDEGTLDLFKITTQDVPELILQSGMGPTYTIEPYGNFIIIDNSSYTYAPEGTFNYLGWIDGAEPCSKIVVNGPYCYVANRTTGYCTSYSSNIAAMDISTIYDPFTIAYYSDLVPSDLATINEWLFVINNNSELLMYQIGATGNITMFDAMPIENAEFLKVTSDRVIVDIDTGYLIFKYDGTAGLEWLSAITE